MLIKHDNIPIVILTRVIFIHFSEGHNARSAHISLREQLGDTFEISYHTVKKIYRKLQDKLKNAKYLILIWNFLTLKNMHFSTIKLF